MSKPFDISHRAFYFSKEILLIYKTIKFDKIYFSVFDQLLRSATSIGANVVEGKAGSSHKDFVNFYRIALKSANETKYWLCLIRDTEISNIEKEQIENLIMEADEISKIVASIILNTQKNK